MVQSAHRFLTSSYFTYSPLNMEQGEFPTGADIVLPRQMFSLPR